MKVNIITNQAVFSSGVKVDDIKEVQRFKPEALQIVNKETKDVEFKYGFAKGTTPFVGLFGINFNEVSDNGYAVAKVDIPSDVEDKKVFVTETYGAAISKANSIEGTLEGVVSSIDEELEEIGKSVNTLDL